MKVLKAIIQFLLFLFYVALGGILLIIDISYFCFTHKNIKLLDKYFDYEDRFNAQ
jgi:hypothetical protein